MYTCLTNKNCSIEWPWYFETVFMNQWLKATFLPTISLSLQGAYSTIFWGTFFYRNLSKKWTFDLRMCILLLELLKKGKKWNSIQCKEGKIKFFSRHSVSVCYMVLSTHIQTWSSFSCRPVILSCVNVMWLMKRIHNNTYGKWRIHYSKKRVK